MANPEKLHFDKKLFMDAPNDEQFRALLLEIINEIEEHMDSIRVNNEALQADTLADAFAWEWFNMAAGWVQPDPTTGGP